MSRSVVFVLLAILLLRNCVLSSDDDLESVIVLYRHGDRAPLKPYKNDPYDQSYWPFGFGQLTNIGKSQQYALGQWLRVRYTNFLPTKYHESDIKVLSSNTDRCLMSAASNLAGLYPPKDDQIWNTKLNWQPIPIHTTPKKEDAILAQAEPCEKYDKLYKELLDTAEFKDIFQDNENLFDYLSEFSGDNITTLVGLQTLYNTLFVEDLYNLTLPIWAKIILSADLQFKNLNDFTWRTFTYTPDLARLKAGPLIDLIATHFENITCNTGGVPKFLMLSAHDSTVVSLLNALHIFELHTPPYTATVILELRRKKKSHFVNIYYKNSTTAVNLTIPGCHFNCDFDDFRKTVQPLRLNSADKEKECQG